MAIGQSRPNQAAGRHGIGASLDLSDLSRDPYPIFRAMRQSEPISWVPALKMWYVVKYEDCREILMDSGNFSNASSHSLVQSTFGEQMLSSDGDTHVRYKAAARRSFAPSEIRKNIEPRIQSISRDIISGFASRGACEFRSAFASRLPVLTTLAVFGIPQTEEYNLRRWYDAFEAALSNFTQDQDIRVAAHSAVEEFHALLTRYMGIARRAGGEGLLARLVNAPEDVRLSDDEIRRNASIIFFGGISTVEALILNTLYALDTHADVRARLRGQAELAPAVIEEVIRWMSPVQSATRHVTRTLEFRGVTFREGDVVNCMLGAANRDPEIWENPDEFDIDREEVGRHLAFAAGPHYCLGLHLAKAEARIALETLLAQLPDWRIDPDGRCPPEGYEFRQPRSMPLLWDVVA